jgi:hypothetical protein
MVENSSPDWRALAHANRIDPAEVELVFERFDAQRQFAAKGRGEPIALGQWFRFYRMEKASEGQQAAPAPSACSVDSDAVNNACIERPVEFLAVLQAYLAAEA